MSSVSFPPMGCRSITLTEFNHAGSFFFSVPRLLALPRRVFRGNFVAGLKSAFPAQALHFSGELTLLAQPKALDACDMPISRQGVETRHAGLRDSGHSVIETSNKQKEFHIMAVSSVPELQLLHLCSN
jgi:hypothetical protein